MTCQEGYYELVKGSGVCVPNFDTLLKQQLAQAAAQSTEVQGAVKEAGIQASAYKLVEFVKERPIAAGAIGLVVVFGIYQAMKKVI